MSRAGQRQAKYRKNGTGMGRISDEKVGILVTAITRQLAIHDLDPAEWDEENEIAMASEQGSNIVLLIPVPGRSKPLSWNISAMTTAELEATRQFFEYLFNLADPIIRERDRVANDAFNRGDDSYIRVFRPIPQLITRARKKRTDCQGVHNRPSDASEGSGD